MPMQIIANPNSRQTKGELSLLCGLWIPDDLQFQLTLPMSTGYLCMGGTFITLTTFVFLMDIDEALNRADLGELVEDDLGE